MIVKRRASSMSYNLSINIEAITQLLHITLSLAVIC